ncbi:MAG TPA: DUF3667 domain-containing protein [Candidatus Dormibacteraeota bacterium]|nr:DUF3667 domain-containing protein [Candidatus Dormibacteraeota bacterium]
MDKTLQELPESNASGNSWTCITCGHAASGHFCAHCGEKRRGDHDFSLAHVLAEAAEAFFHVDSKIFVTLKTLVTKPGRLTADFFLGRRKPYMSPLQIFFVCNLLFFVLQPLTGLEILAPPLRIFESNMFLRSTATRLIDQRLAKLHLSRSNPEQFKEFTERFARVAHLQAKSLILALALMLAVIVATLNFRKRRYFSEHLIFSLHAYAWWLLWLLAILIIMSLALVGSRMAGHQVGMYAIDYIATLLEFGGLGAYLFLASRSFYQDKLIPGLIKGVVLTICGYGLFFVYRLLLFFTVLYST